MAGKLASFFPGQGAYIPGIFAKMDERPVAVNSALQSVDAVSTEYWGERVSPLLLDVGGPRIGELIDEKPELLSLAIFATSVASYHLFVELGAQPDVVVGHSFGEIAAAVAAKMLTTDEAARAICERDMAFRDVSPPPGGLLAVATNVRRAGHLLSFVDEYDLDIAVDNGPGQTVVSGTTAALENVARVAAALDIDTMTVPARYPYHSKLLYDVADEFSERVDPLPARAPRRRLYSPIIGGYISDTDYVRQLGSRHFTQPVRFREALQVLYADGVRTFVSCGARDVLGRLVTTNLPADVSVVTPFGRRADIEQVRESLAAVAPVSEPVAVVARPRVVTETLPTNGLSDSESGEDNRAVEPAAPSEDGLSVPDETSSDTGDGSAAIPTEVLPPQTELIEILRATYADTLGYPQDVLTDDADLEADLGIDSIKQVDTFARMRSRFNLPEPPDGVQPTAYTTLSAVADLLRELAEGKVMAEQAS